MSCRKTRHRLFKPIQSLLREILESPVGLFGDSRYEYRDTFFVLFKKENRPSSDKIQACLAELGPKYETLDLKATDGELESITVRSPNDRSAMDITFVQGEEVTAQIQEILTEFRTITLAGDDVQKLQKLGRCDARFDIYHFEQCGNTDEEMLDPGGLLIVLETIAQLCDGVGLDPQSQALM